MKNTSMLIHLVELRQRLIYSLCIFLFIFGVSFYYSAFLLAWLAKPLYASNQFNSQFISTSPQELFLVKMQLSLHSAIVFTCPFILHQLWKFVSPGLYKNEKKPFFIAILMSPILFTMGFALAYWVVLPTANGFFLSQASAGVVFTPKVNEYYDFTITVLFAFGLCFQFPLLILMLYSIGIVDLALLKSARRYVIVIAFIIGGVLTPPDILSQLFLAIPLILLFELTVLGLRWL